MLLLCAVGLAAFLLGARSALATAFFLVPAALTALAAVAGIYPYGTIRQDIFLTPMVYICAALGADRLVAAFPRRLPGAVAAGALIALSLAVALPGLGASIALLSQSPGYQPMRMVVGTLGEQLYVDRNRTIYVYYNAIPAFRYYWRGRDDPWIAGSLHRSYMDEEKAREQMLAVQNDIRALTARGEPYWVVLSHIATADESWFLEILARSGDVEFVEGASNSSLLRVTPFEARSPANRTPT